jgi:hypothetical protein
LGHSVLKRGARDSLSRPLTSVSLKWLPSTIMYGLGVDGRAALGLRPVAESREPQGHRAAAASVFFGSCTLPDAIRGIAAIKSRVYSCWGLVKICSATPHSTISPW